jgi:hypothetical protein
MVRGFDARFEPIADSATRCFDRRMSIAAAQADSFFREAIANGSVWTIRDSEGFPTSTNTSGETAMPFWSLESRAMKLIARVPAYHGFEPFELGLPEFCEKWLPGLERDGLKAGLNWSGERATGYDLSPADVQARIDSVRR